MTYELAKQLKNAGFPSRFMWGEYEIQPPGVELRCPTLSELIEACGEEFQTLGRIFLADKKTTDSPNKWMVGGFSKDAEGSTPEEAVANLWLELNKHSVTP